MIFELIKNGRSVFPFQYNNKNRMPIEAKEE